MEKHQNTDEIKEVTSILKQGGLIVFNTDTVPALGCDATNTQAVAKILEITEREPGCGLVILALDLNMVARHVQNIPAVAEQLAEVSDSPVTIIYPKGSGLAPGVTAQNGSVAIRIPENTFCNHILRRVGRPIVATIPLIGDSSDITEFYFEDIDQEILDEVQWITPDEDSPDMSGKTSSLISLDDSGKVKIIRE
jgi:L-threonylcarbamoyladenylate synthase